MENYLKNNISLESFVTLFSQAPNALAMLVGESMIIEAANSKILEMWGKTEVVISMPLLEALPEIHDQEFPHLLLQVYKTGIPFQGYSIPAILMKNGELQTSYFNFSYSPIFDDFKNVTGIIISATDVTENVISENRLKESEFKFKELILNSEYPSAIFAGPNLVIELANDKMIETWGVTKEVIGLPLEEAIPTLKGQPFLDILRHVYESGETHIAKDDLALLMRNGVLEPSYYNYSYQPIKNSSGEVYAIFNVALEVTEMVLAKKSALENFNKLNNFIENIPMAIAVYKCPELILEMHNKDAENIWEEITIQNGMHITKIFSQYESSGLSQFFEKVCATGKQIEIKEMKFHHEAHNKDVYINCILHPTIDNEGKVETITVIAYDVTNELVMKRNLGISEEKYKNLTEAIPQIIWTADADGKVNYVNERLYFYMGKDTENIIGKEFYSLCHPADQKHVENIWKKAVAGKTDFEIEFRSYNSTRKEYLWLLTRVVPSFDADGELVKWIGTSTDINEVKLLQAQKDTFLGIASHELKTPLTSLKLYAQVLERVLRKSGDNKNAEFANKMDVQISKLNALIVDLLDVTKISAGKMQLVESNFSCATLAKEMVEEMQLDSKHHLIFEKHSEGTVFADRNRISQVMSNLISNAIKYSPDSQEILITCTNVDDQVVFSVKDFGIGIPNNIKDRVFEQYYRVSGKEQSTISGLGLGLYISADIIERSNGRIWVESTLGEGSTFNFSLPVAIN